MTLPALALDNLYAPVREDLPAVAHIFDRELHSSVACVNELCDMVQGYRGKMLRPALLLLCGRAAGGEVTPSHHVLATVVEMVHMATLVHDDVLDQADLRRRQATVNATSGNVAAVLLGDYLISHAFHLCSSLESQAYSRLIGDTTNRVCEGELLQNHHSRNPELDEATYLEIISRKTAALTATSCALGAMQSGADERTVSAMEQFGHSAGIAFQIVDDILDIVGTSERMGKTLGRDFDLGKATLPTIHCMSRLAGPDADTLRSAIADGSVSLNGELRQWLERTDSITYAFAAARSHVKTAIDQLESLPRSDSRDCLQAMAEFILARQT